eukprot:TRINITY_DN4479_c0_g1_i1.p1 TRINITY_DN4479_c0_g1~~TRINITY_DN4479_c0_g1_i1.p1  ORF type:complete len:413 (+),score=104.64 TRINITY_DN4479_c0_g1_i1:14-1252(+)
MDKEITREIPKPPKLPSETIKKFTNKGLLLKLWIARYWMQIGEDLCYFPSSDLTEDKDMIKRIPLCSIVDVVAKERQYFNIVTNERVFELEAPESWIKKNWIKRINAWINYYKDVKELNEMKMNESRRYSKGNFEAINNQLTEDIRQIELKLEEEEENLKRMIDNVKHTKHNLEKRVASSITELQDQIANVEKRIDAMKRDIFVTELAIQDVDDRCIKLNINNINETERFETLKEQYITALKSAKQSEDEIRELTETTRSLKAELKDKRPNKKIDLSHLERMKKDLINVKISSTEIMAEYDVIQSQNKLKEKFLKKRREFLQVQGEITRTEKDMLVKAISEQQDVPYEDVTDFLDFQQHFFGSLVTLEKIKREEKGMYIPEDLDFLFHKKNLNDMNNWGSWISQQFTENEYE